MGKVRRKFTIGFKKQVVDEVESGLLSKSAAARKYEVSSSVIDHWIMKARDGVLNERPSNAEKALRAENEKLKAKVGELTMLVDVLKKMEDYGRQRRSEISSAVISKNLALYRGGAK